MALPDVLAAAESGIDRSDFSMLDSAHEASGAWWHQTRDGMRLSVEVTSYEMEYEHRPARQMIVRDLTQQERTPEQLRVSEERWQLALHGTGDALWDWDLRSGRVFRSPRWSAMLGYGAYEIGDKREDFTSLLHRDDVERVEEALNEYFGRKTDTFSVEYRLRRKDGVYRWILDRGRAIWDERDQPLRMAGSQTDVTERKEAEERLEQEAQADALTSLPNRREFDRVLALEFQRAKEAGGRLSVCVCDLDRFNLTTAVDLGGRPQAQESIEVATASHFTNWVTTAVAVTACRHKTWAETESSTAVFRLIDMSKCDPRCACSVSHSFC